MNRLILKMFVTLSTVFLSLSLNAQFAAEFEFVYLDGATNGQYRMVGLFNNDEPTKDTIGNKYDYQAITTDGNTYYVDTEGRVFQIVAKFGSSPLTLEVNNLDGENYKPAEGDGLITTVNEKTNEFYISGPLSLNMRAKLQRINLIRRKVVSGSGAGGTGVIEGYYTDYNEGEINIRIDGTTERVKQAAGPGLKISETETNNFKIDNTMYTEVHAKNHEDAGRLGVKFGQYFFASKNNTMGYIPGTYLQRIDITQ